MIDFELIINQVKAKSVVYGKVLYPVATPLLIARVKRHETIILDHATENALKQIQNSQGKLLVIELRSRIKMRNYQKIEK